MRKFNASFISALLAIDGPHRGVRGQISSDTCVSQECNDIASTILENLDPSINPCENFYQFACGGFVKNAIIPEGETKTDAFVQARIYQRRWLRATLEEEVTQAESKVIRYTKTLYKSCMNVDLIERQSLETLSGILQNLGRWPADFGGSNVPNFLWTTLESQFRKLGYARNHFISVFITLDQKNSTQWRITLDQPQLSLAREYLLKGLNGEEVKAYLDYMIDVAVFLGSSKEFASKKLRKALEFEISLANISLPDEGRRDASKLYNLMTLENLSKEFPSIPWSRWINSFLSPKARLKPNEEVNVMVPKFIADFEKLVRDSSQEAQTNYALWRVVADSVDYLEGEIREIQLAYLNKTTGKTEREPRWQECMDLVSRRLFPSVGALYVRKYFQKSARERATILFRTIQYEFRKLIQQADWMDELTQIAALEKADALHGIIAYPDELMKDSVLDRFYADLVITDENYFQSILNLTLFDTGYLNSQLRLPVNKSDWITYSAAAEVDGVYLPNDNSIFYPAGILQGAFFGKNRPQYTNYGAIGYVIGHEITHAFDDLGSQYDKNGELNNWWQDETRETFSKRVQCIMEQYGNYTDEETGLQINGMKTQGENVADNVGLKVAYLAYREYVRRVAKDQKLPNLDGYTPEKLFWISAASVYCTKTRKKSLEIDITVETHTPAQFRVIGPMSNNPDFARDFNCPKGSKMNPEKKCDIW
ncbi:hypothetical protein QAD02_010155 [Eretmocerus hayati]|uniref:Uncharacterized protein n=1 Tax=Eretmocerus hayati TaxID=131215 RepID=A0ACC2NBE6_9HYME|nr:hypothetical protein QAD02_010155 [Eretmocerus hayati]